MRLKLIFYSKRMKAVQTIKMTSSFEVIPCNNAITFLLQDYVILLFIYSKSLKELFLFHRLSYVLKYKLKVSLFL